MPFEIVPLGDAALLVRVGESLGAVLGAAQRLEAAELTGVQEIVPALASVAVFFEKPMDFTANAKAVQLALGGQKTRSARAKIEPRLLEVPVCYSEDLGPDLAAVAQHCALSPNEVVRKHAGGRYRVRCLGFTPGFPFLAGLPAKLATPRRASPRTVVPAGSVGIGGNQTGIYPLPSPGGWNIIGRTPLRLFDLEREPPALLRPGDQVRFVSITREEFERWER